MTTRHVAILYNPTDHTQPTTVRAVFRLAGGAFTTEEQTGAPIAARTFGTVEFFRGRPEQITAGALRVCMPTTERQARRFLARASTRGRRGARQLWSMDVAGVCDLCWRASGLRCARCAERVGQARADARRVAAVLATAIKHGSPISKEDSETIARTFRTLRALARPPKERDEVAERVERAARSPGIQRGPTGWRAWPAHVTFSITERAFLQPFPFVRLRLELALPFEAPGLPGGPFEHISRGYVYNVEGLTCATCKRAFGDADRVDCERTNLEAWRWIHAPKCPPADAPPALCERLPHPEYIARILGRKSSGPSFYDLLGHEMARDPSFAADVARRVSESGRTMAKRFRSKGKP